MADKIAVIPWSNAWLKDKMFVVDDPVINIDHRNNGFWEMKKEFERRGDSFHTIDLYPDLKEVDFFLFFELDWNWLDKVVKAGGEERMVYCNAEPPVVNPMNSPEGYRFLKRFFPYILTWNRDWIDGKTIFKRNIPYYFMDHADGGEFSGRKLLTSISGNKKSKHPDELYSERERVITFFENHYPDDFQFYGTGWDKEVHPGYGGRVDKKIEIYHRYKFAVCFENMKNIKGYVTEKLFDCLTAGIVPIYAGAEDIREYVPEECFIDYWKFDNLNSLAEFLTDMGEKEYQSYLDAARNFLHSACLDKFSGAEYARNIYEVMAVKKKFHMSWINRGYIKWIIYKCRFLETVKGWVKRLIRRK